LTEDHEGEVKEFVPSVGLTEAEAERLLLIHGKNELVEIKKPKVIVVTLFLDFRSNCIDSPTVVNLL
jgi:hypothetical protein